MNLSNVSPIVTGLALLALVAQADAAERKSSIDLKASAGYRYDSNVSIDEIDSNTGEADSALLLEVGIDGKIPVSDSLSIGIGYGITQTDYLEYSTFDTAIHRLESSIAYRQGGFDTGLALRHFAARLDGERFLDIRQVSPAIARLVGNKVYLRGAFTNSGKMYADSDKRDATNNALDLDAYLLLDGMRRFIALGYRVDREDAASAALDYEGTRIKVTYGHELDSLPLLLKARLQLDSRDYQAVTESIGSERRDERLRVGMTATWTLSQHVRLEADAEFADSRSNFAPADFDETVYAVNLAAKF